MPLEPVRTGLEPDRNLPRFRLQHPARPLVVAWGVLIGAVAAVLLLAGGLTVLPHATILVALPFAIVMLALIMAVLRDMSTDPMARPHRRAAAHGARSPPSTR